MRCWFASSFEISLVSCALALLTSINTMENNPIFNFVAMNGSIIYGDVPEPAGTKPPRKLLKILFSSLGGKISLLSLYIS